MLVTAVERVKAAYARIDQADRPEVWIALRPQAEVLDEAASHDAAAQVAEPGSLAGMLLAVKDNVDVAGLPTSAGCSAYAYLPTADAPAVARLRAAGAIVLGKTNMDQFATGLVGTRTPHGAVRDMRRPDHVSGGSSAGSALAVALGIADIAIGTDTAGSGRVPAAFQGLIGIKPTFGLVPTRGSVAACRSLDCLTMFAAELELAQRAAWTMAGPDPDDPSSRGWPLDAPLAAPAVPCIALPDPDALGDLSPDARSGFAAFAERLETAGCRTRIIDIDSLLEAGRLLYEGAFVAERHEAVGAFVDAHRSAVDPIVGEIVAAAGTLRAADLAADRHRLSLLRMRVRDQLEGSDALLMPTTTRQPTLAEVATDPIGANSRLGIYTNFCNLLDMSALAIPAGSADGGNFGVTLFAPAFGDMVLADVAGRVMGVAGSDGPAGPSGISLVVVGAHRTGQPLNHELTDRGARRAGVVHTAPSYRLLALDTIPPKPGLVRVERGGASIEGELWNLPAAGLGDFLAKLPAPMTLGPVTLADGRQVVGFGCEPEATVDAADITSYGSWLAYAKS
jgi:allophanate hydrolase